MLFYLLSRKSSGPLPPTTSFSGCPFSRHFGEKIRTELDAEINLQPLSTLYFINDRFCCLFKPVLLPWPIHGMAMAVKERWPFSQPASSCIKVGLHFTDSLMVFDRHQRRDFLSAIHESHFMLRSLPVKDIYNLYSPRVRHNHNIQNLIRRPFLSLSSPSDLCGTPKVFFSSVAE